MRRPGDARLERKKKQTIFRPRADIIFPSSGIHIFWVHDEVLVPEHTGPCNQFPRRQHPCAENFITGPIESVRLHWEGWESTQ